MAFELWLFEGGYLFQHVATLFQIMKILRKKSNEMVSLETNVLCGDLSELYIVFLGTARFFRLLFWLKMYFDGNKFMALIIADIIHCATLFNFIYNVIKKWSGSGLPTTFTEIKNNSNKKMF